MTPKSYEKGVPLLQQTRAMEHHLTHVRTKAASVLIQAIYEGSACDHTNINGVNFGAVSLNDVCIFYEEKGISPLLSRGKDGATLSVIDGVQIVPGVMGCSLSLETGRTNTGGIVSAARLIDISRKL